MPRNNFVVVAFHTPDARYSAEAKRLERSLISLGVPHSIRLVDTSGWGWAGTTMQKPIWMWSTREELEGDILFVDADTIFHQNPRESLAKVKGDIGLFLNANGPVSSAVFVRDTERGTCFLRLWKNACEEILSNEIADDLNSLNPEKSDQDVLKHLINKYGQDLFWADFGVQALPTEMCFIYGSSEWNIPKKQVVLEHLQASRTLRREFRPLARRQMRIAVLHFKFLTRLFARKRNKPGV